MCESQCVRSRFSSRISISISPFVVFIITSFAFLPSNSRASYSNKKIIWEYYSNWSTLSPNFDSNNSTFFSSSEFFLCFFLQSFSKKTCLLEEGGKVRKISGGGGGGGEWEEKGEKTFSFIILEGGNWIYFYPKIET